MTKKFIFTVIGIVAAIIAIALTIVIICASGKDSTTTNKGSGTSIKPSEESNSNEFVSKPTDISSLYDLVKNDDYDSLVLDLSSIECSYGENIKISDLSYRKRIEIDGKGKSFDNMQINSNASEIVIKNIKADSMNTILSINNSSAKVSLVSCRFNTEYDSAVKINARDCDMSIVGYCEIKSGSSVNAFEANDITFKGTGEILISGGDSKSYGGNGGCALVAKIVSFAGTLKADIIGGNGHVGSRGPDGENGRDATFGKVSTDGSDGNPGGKGGDGGAGLICREVHFASSVDVTIKGGNGANGGQGGAGGDSGQPEMPWIERKGGQGADGGAGGRGGVAINIELTEVPKNVIIVDGAEGAQGQRGADGRGKSG